MTYGSSKNNISSKSHNNAKTTLTQENNETNTTENNTTQMIEEPILNTTTKTIIGGVEKVRILPENILFEARIDTGAKTSSLGVDSYKEFKEDGKSYVEIEIDGKKFKHKVVDHVLIKQHGGDSKRRPIIKLRIVIGEISEVARMTLEDRSNFEFQLLIGRNVIKDRFVVDVSQQFTIEPKIEEKE